VTPLDLVDNRRQPLLWSWMASSDDLVVADLAARLDEGESLENVTVTLWQLRGYGESADADKTGTMVVGSPQVSDATALVRLKDLERGRYYRLELLYGAAGNRRGSGLLIHCED
jgi:hypothetical protein